MKNGRGTKIFPVVEEDFSEVTKHLKTKKLFPGVPSPKMLNSARRMHFLTYSLILWRFRLKKVQPRGKVFIDEIASDALQVLPQALAGYRKTTSLLMRGIIENVMRHIYFNDHPIEFLRLQSSGKFLTNDELFKYLKAHPALMDAEIKFCAINNLETLYDDLSKNIHGRKVEHLEMHRALKNISFDQVWFDVQVRAMEKCAESSNFLLLMYQRDEVIWFPEETKSILLSTIPPKARQIIKGLS
jgi:hypothetical protein